MTYRFINSQIRKLVVNQKDCLCPVLQSVKEMLKTGMPMLKTGVCFLAYLERYL
jgi:hypothetical protein